MEPEDFESEFNSARPTVGASLTPSEVALKHIVFNLKALSVETYRINSELNFISNQLIKVVQNNR